MYRNKLFVAPKAVKLGFRWETSLSDGVVALNKEVEENSYNVSILQTILSLLSNPIFANQIIEENFFMKIKLVFTKVLQTESLLKNIIFFPMEVRSIFVSNCVMTEWGLQIRFEVIQPTIM